MRALHGNTRAFSSWGTFIVELWYGLSCPTACGVLVSPTWDWTCILCTGRQKDHQGSPYICFQYRNKYKRGVLLFDSPLKHKISGFHCWYFPPRISFCCLSSVKRSQEGGGLGGTQDGGGIGRGDHFLPYKFIERTFEPWANSTKQLLITSRGHQAPRKASHCLQKEVGQNIEDKGRDKRARDGDPSREGSQNRGSFQTPGNPLKGGSGGSFPISEGNLTGRKNK